MDADQGDRLAPAPVVLTLAYAPIPIAIAGWFAGHTSTERTTEPWQFTAAMIHGLAATTFAVIFGLSAVAIAVVVTVKLRDRPASATWRRFPLWQGIVILLGAGWALAVALTIELNLVEPILGLGVAAASIGAFVQASTRDAASTERRVARREALTPARRNAQRTARVVVPVALVALATVGVGVAQIVPVTHLECTITNTGRFSSGGTTTHSFGTDRCGSFIVDTAAIDPATLDGLFTGTVTITSRGFAIGGGVSLFPVPVAIAIERDQPGG